MSWFILLQYSTLWHIVKSIFGLESVGYEIIYARLLCVGPGIPYPSTMSPIVSMLILKDVRE